jgi:NADPH2:quinone reductase
MRALLCKEFGPADALVIEKIDDPVPQKGEVLIDVHAAGLNFPDTLAISGKYQVRSSLPFIPGGEAAGEVVAVGAGVEAFGVGDRVMTTGITGAFAQKVCRPAGELTRMPRNMSWETGAGFLVTYGTSYYALKQRAQLRAGETLMVLGAAGGVGLAAVDIGSAMGATVIAAASSEEKLDVASAAGAALRINYSRQSLKEEAKSLTSGRGADVVYDPVGGDFSEQALRATAWDGRFVVVGFAAGTIPKIPLNLPLLKNNSIVGVLYGGWTQHDPAGMQQNISELLEMYAGGKLQPLTTEVFELDDYKEAFATLTGRRAKGKVVFSLKP